MGATRKFNFLVTVVILCSVSNFAYAWTPYYEPPFWPMMDEFGNVEEKPPFINLSLDNPTNTDLLSIDAWTWLPGHNFAPIDATYSIADFNINIDVVLQNLDGSGLGFISICAGKGATVEVGMLAEGEYTVNANIYVTPWESSEPVLYELDTISFGVAPGIDAITIPEPATLLMLAFGTLLLRRKT